MKPTKKYVFKPIFWLEKLMKFICNKLGNEDQHMLNSKSSKKSISFLGTFMFGVHKTNVLPQNHFQNTNLIDHYTCEIIYLVFFLKLKVNILLNLKQW